jgi:hypothetical protein
LASAVSAPYHAFLWAGTAASAVDLHPSGYSFSSAITVLNGVEAGYGLTSDFKGHALLWSGTAASVIDIHPADFTESAAIGLGGGHVVGRGQSGDRSYHALYWDGFTPKAVDLHPAGFSNSYAVAVDATLQAGYAYLSDGITTHAMLWSGTAASAVDLQMLLPGAGNWSTSRALEISASGDVYGWAYGTYNGVTDYFAVKWSVAVPESSSALSVIAAATAAMKRRTRR